MDERRFPNFEVDGKGQTGRKENCKGFEAHARRNERDGS
jgi:hypothetical protein